MRKTLSLALGLSIALAPSLAQAAPTVAAIKAVKTNIGGAAAAGHAGLASFKILGPLNRSFSPSLTGGLKTGTVHALKLDSNAATAATEAASSSIAAPIVTPVSTKVSLTGDSISAAASSNETTPVAKSEPRSVFSRAAAFAAELGRSIKLGKSDKAAAASNRLFDNGSLRRGETESKVQGRFAALGRSNSDFGLKSADELPEAANDAAFDAEEAPTQNKGPPAPEGADQPAKKKSVWRSVKLGWMTAIGMLFLYTAVDLIAGLVGYTFTPSYTMPEVAQAADPTWWSHIVDTFMAAVMAPL
ncbi:MAG: hypothetical protein V3S11_05665, partial [Elusimicrobiota bacterium]